MLREGMFLADRYEIIEQIGTGGMADVYKAKCHKLNRYVAIKVMKSEFSQDKTFVSKFWAEDLSILMLSMYMMLALRMEYIILLWNL
jgi:serine/threonine protein kinase